jgi:hypothetical protein
LKYSEEAFKMKIEFLPLARFIEIHREYIDMKDQMENTCGPYALTYILRGLGYKIYNNIEISEDFIAHLARTRISPEEVKLREEAIRRMLYNEEPYEKILEKYGKVLYRYDLPISDKPEEIGTSVEGLKYALEVITNKDLIGVPIPSRRKEKIYFDEQRFMRLINVLMDNIERWSYQAIMNIQTDLLINNIGLYHDLFRVIFSNKPEHEIGRNLWKAGHFVSLAGFLKVYRNTSDVKIYLLIRDTYKNIGYRGYHIQPIDAVRKALVRNDGREGGIMLIIKREFENEVKNAIESIGIPVEIWDNGSPF